MDAKDRIIEQRMAKRRHSALVLRSIIALLLVLAAVLAVILIRAAIVDGAFDHVIVQVKQRLGMSVEGEDPGPILTEKQTEAADTARAKKILKKARKLAAQYDYQGAIVAIEPSTGKIRAMVSKPDYNPNTINEIWSEIIGDASSSVLLNRATLGLYPPGSTYKVITALEYVTEHLHSYRDFVYKCKGETVVNSNLAAVEAGYHYANSNR